jgi:valyl-tRNA synthetase
MQKLVGPAIEHVKNDDIEFFPPKFKNTYFHWMENIRDWPISRQLWWGQQIPAYYMEDGTVIVAETEEEALAQAVEKTGNDNLQMSDLKRDEDVVDTWFSSWLWPISVFDGFEKKDELDYYYPTNVLVTGWDIIFFWVARMIIAGYEYMDERPFKDVYFTGMVRDMQRRKMSKSLGNSPDALELIKKYGADGMRVGMLLSAPAGNDLLFDEKLCEQGRNFSNKIWNAYRLVSGWEAEEKEQPEYASLAIDMFRARMNAVLSEMEGQFESYRLSDALMNIYKLVWDDFCSSYLEMIKPPFGEHIDSKTLGETVRIFETLLTALHPFMPFITEEIWQAIGDRNEGEYLAVAQLQSVDKVNAKAASNFDKVQQVITQIRSIRQEKGIANKDSLELYIRYHGEGDIFEPVLTKMANLSVIETVTSKPDGAVSFMVGKDEYFIPLVGIIDVEEEKEKLETELKYQEGFLNSVMKKLGNERFVNNAPEKVVAMEQQKKADAEAKIAALKEQLASLG